MEHLPATALSSVFKCLTARDVGHVAMTCRALSTLSSTVKDAIEYVIAQDYGHVVGFLRSDDARWPRNALTIRAAEVLYVKQVLTSTPMGSFEDAGSWQASSSVLVSKAWVSAWRKRALLYEQYITQFRDTKKKQQQRERAAKKRKPRGKQATQILTPSSAKPWTGFHDKQAEACREAGELIMCSHLQLLPASRCIGHSKRAILPEATVDKVDIFTGDLKSFALDAQECYKCRQEIDAQDEETNRRKTERFANEINGSNALFDLLFRKTGYPKELFSPDSTRGNTRVNLRNASGKSYYLVPKKWLTRWRKYVQSLSDDMPGPILNAELVCLAHKRSIIPPYITMFLSGFSLEQSLQTTQGFGITRSKQYEIVALKEWEALYDRYCAEFSVGFDVSNGSYHWQSQECLICAYGIGGPPVDQPNSSR